MKSDVIILTSQDPAPDAALHQAEAVASYCGLDKKSALHLRLLTEELMGLLHALTGELEAEFWIENRGMDFQLHMTTRTLMNLEKREKLLSASSSGKNAAAKGVLGKLRDVFACSLDARQGLQPWYHEAGMVDPVSYAGSAAIIDWSMRKYRRSVEEKLTEQDPEAQEAWDELEKSIINRLADEISIGIRGDRVEMVVYKRF